MIFSIIQLATDPHRRTQTFSSADKVAEENGPALWAVTGSDDGFWPNIIVRYGMSFHGTSVPWIEVLSEFV
jgi:hypothetical protein